MALDWPAFDVERDSPTFALLHLVSQMLGKLRVAHAPWANHGWHATLHPVAEGLTIEPIAAPKGNFTLTLDLCRHAIVLRVADGERDLLPLDLGSVAALHRCLVEMLESHGLPSSFNGKPNEIVGAVPFSEDIAPREYRPDSADRLHAALARIVPVFERFRAGFQGKASPRPFLLGQLRSCRHPFLGTACAAASRRYSRLARPYHPGGVQPRRVERRLLAGRRDRGRADFLQLCLSRTARVSGCGDVPCRGSVRRNLGGICIGLRCRPEGGQSRSHADGLPAIDL